jgi:hypothetical protein
MGSSSGVAAVRVTTTLTPTGRVDIVASSKNLDRPLHDPNGANDPAADAPSPAAALPRRTGQAAENSVRAKFGLPHHRVPEGLP